MPTDEDDVDSAVNKLDDRTIKIGKEALSSEHETLTKTRQECAQSLDDAVHWLFELRRLRAFRIGQTTDAIEGLVLNEAISILRAMGYAGTNAEFSEFIGAQNGDDAVDIDVLRQLVNGSLAGHGILKRPGPEEITSCVRAFESKTHPGMINILELSYVLQGKVGDPISKSEFDRILLDLDFDEATGMVPISTVLYFFGGKDGVAPSDRHAARRRIVK